MRGTVLALIQQKQSGRGFEDQGSRGDLHSSMNSMEYVKERLAGSQVALSVPNSRPGSKKAFEV
jgi:hypothetical protein